MPHPLFHPANFVVGWSLVLAAFVSGAIIGLRFHREDFLGGYASLRRRILRLGHVALAALGLFNVVFSICPLPAPGTAIASIAGWGFIVGGITMPVVCFLTAWQARFRHLFCVPVLALLCSTASILIGAIT